MKHVFTISFLFFSLWLSAQENPAINNPKEKKVSRLGEYKGYSEAKYGGFDYRSFYFDAGNGLKLAVDVFLPKKRKEGEKFPAILYLTRYVRSLQAKAMFRFLKDPALGQIGEDEIKFFTSHGYACVIVDARGSGASNGKRDMDFTEEEIKDVVGIMDWIVAQSWSNGKIGTTGVSYVGTTAELIIANRHPAHKAAIPRSAIFDLYEDVSFPGGLRQGPFVNVWGATTAALDRNDIGYVSKMAKMLVKGINPVRDDKKRVELDKAVADHKENYEVYRDILTIEYRDELHKRLNKPIDDYSVHSRIPAIAGSGTTIFRIGGYYDGALAASVIKGLLNTPNTERVLLGPWDHGPHDFASPFGKYNEAKFDIYSEMLRFFDYHLKGIDNGIQREPKLNFYTVGAEKWDTASIWPPAGTRQLQFWFADSSLKSEPYVNSDFSRPFKIDYAFTTGGGARWNSITPLFRFEKHTNYLNWKAKTATCPSFVSEPLADNYTITGEAVFNIFMESDAPDGAVLVFLEEVKPDGSVYYITEGQLRLIHRKLDEKPLYKRNGPSHSYRKADASPMPLNTPQEIVITSLPISYYLPAGSRLRISIAGADHNHSDEVPQKPTMYKIRGGKNFPASVVIPARKN
jgi:putative CocE/NonD family hydrolase